MKILGSYPKGYGGRIRVQTLIGLRRDMYMLGHKYQVVDATTQPDVVLLDRSLDTDVPFGSNLHASSNFYETTLDDLPNPPHTGQQDA